VDYCASGQTGWERDFGAGTWLAEYWNFTNSMNTGNFGANIFVGSPDAYEYTSNAYENWGNSTGPAGQSNFFGTRHTATINVPANCVMEMRLRGDDGYALYVDGVREAHHWSNHGTTTRTSTITLQPGENLVMVEFYEWGGGANIRLEWRIN